MSPKKPVKPKKLYMCDGCGAEYEKQDEATECCESDEDIDGGFEDEGDE